MRGNYSMEYKVDIAMCIDATGSMKSLLDLVKNNALSFHSDLSKDLKRKGKNISELRVRLIVFRDYLADGNNAMLTTNFFSLPAQSAEFERVVRSIQPFGGGDEPEDGLEALAYAMKSQWATDGEKRRHIIIVWTDDATHELGFSAKAANYPQKMVKNFDELTRWWGDEASPGIMDKNAKRLLIYAPERKYWSTISQLWDNTIHFPAAAGKGLQEVEYNEIISLIAQSV